MNSAVETKKGVFFALAAYLLWGLFPIYWKWLSHIPAFEILVHRIFWSILFYLAVILAMKTNWSEFSLKLKFNPKKSMGFLALASALLSVNWFVYIWAVNSNHIVEASLGYFLTPLVNLFLGIVLLKEKISKPLKWAFTIAGFGVLALILDQAAEWWVSMVLASSFGLYGLIKKKLNLSGVLTNLTESSFMILPILVVFFSFGAKWTTLQEPWISDPLTWALLIGSGAVTGLPLIWFTEAARRLPLSRLGLFQYIAPSLQFLTGVLIFDETLSQLKWIGLILIWSSLVISTRQPRSA
jgi:chloramphenicol-sensitive protein RarD